MKDVIPDIAFLGISERANTVKQLQYFNTKSILGLRDVILSNIYPLSLKGFNFVFAIYDPFNFEKSKICIVDNNNKELFSFEIKAERNNKEGYLQSKTLDDECVQSDYPVWTTFLFPINNDTFVIANPEQYKVILKRDSFDISIGCLNFGYIPAPELTQERINAIKSNPAAIKAAKMIFKCNICNEEIGIYTSIENDPRGDKTSNLTWYKSLPDVYKCKCGANIMPMRYLRESMHALLGQTSDPNNISFTRLYEQETLNNICTEFESLLNESPKEERVQVFIENNPILLQQFAAEEVFYKLPILSKYKTDFCIINHKKELLLIEIEQPDIKLLKKDGGVSADLQHAIDQVNDWLYAIDEHKMAVLDCLKIKYDVITSIRGIVIAGRDKTYDSNDLRKLKWKDFGRISFYTYDDILNGIVSLVRSINSM